MARINPAGICGLSPAECRRLLDAALAEDLGRGDITSRAVVPAAARACGVFVAKEAGVVAGLPLLRPLFGRLDRRCTVSLSTRDSRKVQSGQRLARIEGPARALLAGERVALNLLQHLSGIATLTARFVHAVKGTRAQILDTRKTLPGLRAMAKYAVSMGGGHNHRMRLDALVLIKDNHLALAGGGQDAPVEALRRCRALQREGIRVEVETTSVTEAVAAAQAGADIVMLDNMPPAQMRRAVSAVRSIRDRAGRRVIIEASGGITLRRVAAVARTGVDWISVGALTHSAPGLDISLEIRPAGTKGRCPPGSATGGGLA